jgi:hypothetical protein
MPKWQAVKAGSGFTYPRKMIGSHQMKFTKATPNQ